MTPCSLLMSVWMEGCTLSSGFVCTFYGAEIAFEIEVFTLLLMFLLLSISSFPSSIFIALPRVFRLNTSSDVNLSGCLSDKFDMIVLRKSHVRDTANDAVFVLGSSPIRHILETA